MYKKETIRQWKEFDYSKYTRNMGVDPNLVARRDDGTDEYLYDDVSIMEDNVDFYAAMCLGKPKNYTPKVHQRKRRYVGYKLDDLE